VMLKLFVPEQSIHLTDVRSRGGGHV